MLYSSRRGSVDSSTLTPEQQAFFARIEALHKKNERDSGSDGEHSPPPVQRSRSGRRGSLPAIHIGELRPGLSSGTVL